jgi:hypothetical protein
VNAEFQWWLLILGIVIGGALVYLVLADVQGDSPPDDLSDGVDPGPGDDLTDDDGWVDDGSVDDEPVDDEPAGDEPAGDEPAATAPTTSR